jgi:hypothetical protein
MLKFSNRSRLVHFSIAILAVAAVARVSRSREVASFRLDENRLESRVGGCANTKCGTVTCTNGGDGNCYTVQYCIVDPGVPSKCYKVNSTNFARCNTPADGFGCTETSGAHCFKIYTGDVVDETCLEPYCATSTAGCGDTSYSCTSTACQPGT